MAQVYMLDKEQAPTDESITAFLGQPYNTFWASLDAFIEETYQVAPEPHFNGPRHGWTLRYRKGGRPLCEITPTQGELTVLVVLGGKEAAEALSCQASFGANVRACLENAHPYHDGRWLWIHVQEPRDIEDIQQLLLIKRKPGRKKSTA